MYTKNKVKSVSKSSVFFLMSILWLFHGEIEETSAFRTDVRCDPGLSTFINVKLFNIDAYCSFKNFIFVRIELQ